MFVLSSDVTIGNFRFSGVNEVEIKRSLHSIADTAIIKIPSIARIIKNGKTTGGSIITGKQFSDGDPVTIKLGYNGNLQTEFSGFVKRRNLDMPLEVTCEGYSWLLRRNNISQFWPSVTIKDLLKAAVSGIDGGYAINVICDVDFELSNVGINNGSGFDIVNDISKFTDGSLSCFFIQPDTLWCGLVNSPYANGNDVFNAGIVNYRLGYNVVKDNNLKERLTEDDPVEVTYSKRLSNGDKILQTSDVIKTVARAHSKIRNHINDASTLKQLANEKAYQLNYSGYEGSISAFLQPFATPGCQAYITDDRYPERNGTYIIEGTEVHFGINGARRIVEIGLKTGFANDIQND
jgi:hypothetical protein